MAEHVTGHQQDRRHQQWHRRDGEEAAQGRRRRGVGRRPARARHAGARRTCARSSPTTGRSCSARSRCGRFVVLLLTGIFLTLWFKPSMGEVDLPGLLRPAARRPDVRGLRLDAAHLLRRPRRPADAADAPLGGDALRRRDDRAPDARLLHRRVPQAARAQLGDRLACCCCSASSRASPATPCPTTCSPAPASAIADGLIKATPVVGTYMSFFLFGGEFPGDVDHPAALHRARAADPGPPAGPDRRPHAAAGLPQAHPVARARAHRAERRRLPDAAGLHGQGRRVLLHGLRRDRADGRRCCRSTRSGSTGPTTPRR